MVIANKKSSYLLERPSEVPTDAPADDKVVVSV